MAPQVEQLEARQMCSFGAPVEAVDPGWSTTLSTGVVVSFAVVDRVDDPDATAFVLDVTGTESSDYVSLLLDDDANVVVTSNGTLVVLNLGGRAWQTAVRVDGASGADRITNELPAGTFADVVLIGGDGDDMLFARHGAPSHLSGGAGDDLLDGSEGDDLLDGGAGDDWLFAYGGNDELHGGAGLDRMFGGAGDDQLWTDDPDARPYEMYDGGAGNDWLNGVISLDLLPAPAPQPQPEPTPDPAPAPNPDPAPPVPAPTPSPSLDDEDHPNGDGGRRRAQQHSFPPPPRSSSVGMAARAWSSAKHVVDDVFDRHTDDRASE
jgi:Ca2+-binding RTX toxin-like protein